MMPVKRQSRAMTVALGSPRPRAILMLAGAVRRSPWIEAAQRSPLALPVSENESVLAIWLDEVRDVRSALDAPDARLRVITNQYGGDIGLNGTTPPDVELELDPADYRGTGGLMRDLTESYDDDDWVLVVNAFQLPIRPLTGAVRQLMRTRGDVRLLLSDSSSPVVAALIRCEALRRIEPVGFVDFKEQGLPKLARDYVVGVARGKGAFACSVRSHGDYIEALAAFHDPRARSRVDPLEERWRSSFSIVEPGASVHAFAKLNNAVVLKGAKVESGSIVANSVICPGGSVARGSVVRNQLVKGKPGAR